MVRCGFQEKIKQEAEQLRRERDMLIKEKEEQEQIKKQRELDLQQQQQELERHKQMLRDDYAQPLKIDVGRNQYDQPDAKQYDPQRNYDPQSQQRYDPQNQQRSYDPQSQQRSRDCQSQPYDPQRMHDPQRAQHPEPNRTQEPPKPAPKMLPIQKKPLNLRRDVPIPAPKPSAGAPRPSEFNRSQQGPEFMSRSQVLEMNKRPGAASDFNNRPAQVGNSTEEIHYTRPTIEYKLERSPKRGDMSPTKQESDTRVRF